VRPHPPPGCVLVTSVFDIDGIVASFTHAILVPGAELADQAQAGAFVDSYLPWLLPFTTSITHAGSQVARVDLRNWGTASSVLSYTTPDNHGAWSGGQVATACTVIDWRCAVAGSGRTGRTFMPALPDEATQNHATVTEPWRALARDRAVTYLNGLATITGPSGGSCALAVLHSRENGAWLPVSVPQPVVGVGASNLIGTLDRRRPGRGRISPF